MISLAISPQLWGQGKSNMPERINLVSPVRVALVEAGVSSVLVVSAVNAALGELEMVRRSERTGSGTVSKSNYSVSISISERFTGKRTMPLLFDAWHSKIEAANKVAAFDRVAIPSTFEDWLAKFRKPAMETTPAQAPAEMVVA
jgi:hypothetical protein